MNIDKIIKGLTICSKSENRDCEYCPYHASCIYYGCTGELSADVLLLISQLKAENDDLHIEIEGLYEAIDELNDDISDLQNTIDDLIESEAN